MQHEHNEGEERCENCGEVHDSKLDPQNFVAPIFATGKVEPLAVYISQTKHTPETFAEQLLARKFKSVPEELKADVLQKIKARYSGGKNEYMEYHTIILVRDVERGQYLGLAYQASVQGDGRITTPDGAPKGQLFKMGETDDQPSAEMAHMMCVMRHKGTAAERVKAGEWNGELLPDIEIEAEDWAAMQDKLKAAGALQLFTTLFPNTITGENPIPQVGIIAEVSKMSAQKRKELVKRFGEKAIKQLEAKIKAKTQAHE